MRIKSGVLQEDTVYRMFFRDMKTNENKEVNFSATSFQFWHERFGHVNKRIVQDMINKGLVKGALVNSFEDFFCDACQTRKSTQTSIQEEY